MSGKLKEIYSLLNDSEAVLNSYQNEVYEVIIPTVNQLRYAFRHLLEGIDHEKLVICNEVQLDKSIAHCKRALYDAHDAQMIYYLERIKKFNDNNSEVCISNYDDNYVGNCLRLKEIKKSFQAIRKDDSFCRDDYYNQLSGSVEWLKNYCEKLPIFQDEINKNLLSERKSSFFTLKVGILCAVVGAVVAVVLTVCFA